MNLYERLLSYREEDRYPMHMPGHKRNPIFQMENPYSFDVTEVEGTDNLHHPTGNIRDCMNEMKDLYQTQETYLLVNGSTCGILAALSSCCKKGDTILVDRHSHRSVYHAIYLLDLNPVYLYRPYDEATGIALAPDTTQIKKLLSENPKIACMILTSPTYEGVTSDIQKISQIVHKRDIPLIVDQAHGAHFMWGQGIVSNLPRPATMCGADIVIESLHKMLPALTQTALLHIGSQAIDRAMVERYLSIYETSSPSYVLMASVSQCVDWMRSNSTEAFLQAEKSQKWFVDQSEKWNHMSLWHHCDTDPFKWILVPEPGTITGVELADRLHREYRIELEMAGLSYALAMTSPCDTTEGIHRLAMALEKIDSSLDTSDRAVLGKTTITHSSVPVKALVRTKSYEAVNGSHQVVPLEQSEGEIAAEYIMAYPPGIPFLVPGEEITQQIIARIQQSIENKIQILGLEDRTEKTIRIYKEG